ncbi:MAG: hypothetical protein J2P26_13010, partial [Nocardiopsaceae bacterium]|nr:hypothetical protein [Nocardiopsaceae bacterium]
MSRRRLALIGSFTVCAAALAVVLGLVLTRHPAPPRAPAVAPSPAPPTPPRHGPLLSPFTGEPVRALEPVIAVKIDNIVT